eukprot:3042287-Pyramimonas_sp.AAC.1
MQGWDFHGASETTTTFNAAWGPHPPLATTQSKKSAGASVAGDLAFGWEGGLASKLAEPIHLTAFPLC